MDTRKLEILKNDKTTMLGLVEKGAGGDVIARIDPSTLHAEPLREVVRRWNHFPALVEALEEALSDLQSPDMGGLTGAEHDGGAAEGTIHKIREVLKAASE